MKVTFYGQNTLGIEAGGKHLLVDPFISGSDLAKDKVDLNNLKADYILLTHAHQDHVLDVETVAKNNNATIISNAEIAWHYEDKGFNAHPLIHGGKVTFEFCILKYVNANHSSSFADGTKGGIHS